MKNLIYLLSIMFVISCQNENAQNENLGSKEISNLVKTKDLKGQVPREHIIWEYLLNPDETTMTDLVDLYQKRITLEDADYADNLKQMAINAIYKKQLIESGDLKLNDYFVKEQLKLSSNFLSIEDFYKSLQLIEKNYSTDQLTKMALDFDNKNTKAIESMTWRDTKKKEELQMQIIQERLTYYRHGFWKK